MANGQGPGSRLARMAVLRFFGPILVLGAVFFLPAGTFDYWEAWIYLALILVPAVFIVAYLIRHDPALVERRTRMKEREARQNLIVRVSIVFFIAMFLLPGLDRRFGWSNVPTWLVVAADALVALGYLLVFLVYRENTYASRVVQVEEGQKVITTGPYALVRHPMYLGTAAMFLFTPLALGSYWAFIPAVGIIPILVARIINEEQVLTRQLPGYPDYVKKIHYRMFPGLW